MARTSLVFCATALLVQSVYSSCLPPIGYAGRGNNGCGYNGLGANTGYGYNGLGATAGCGYNGFAYDGLSGAGCGCGNSGVASTGGGLAVSSASSIAPVGVSVLSENAYEGTLAAGGNLPFLGTVALEGVLPTAGAGAISYGCGTGGAVDIISEGPIDTGITVPGALFPPGVAPNVATSDALALSNYGSGYTNLGPAARFGAPGAGYGHLGYRYGGCGAVY